MAVVEGLAGFAGDMEKIGGLLDMLRPKATALQNAFEGFGDSISNFGERVMRVVETALGVLLRDAIRWAIDGLKELADSVIEAASDFQLLELRLLGLNIAAAMEEKVFKKGATDAEKYGQAMDYAAQATSRQLAWILKLAAITPYDAVDIARIFTMATSYGFAAKESQRLTENTMDFAAAMGLKSLSMERIMVNFGQMIQRGKVTTREMNDLARGSMLPIADVLEIMAKRMGMSVQKLAAEISKPGGIAAQNFIDAFNEMIETGVRFQGASERMARTYAGAMENLKQTTRDLFGFFVAQPVLDVIGEKIATFLDVLTAPKNWDRVTDALGRIGTGIADILTGLFNMGGGAEGFVDKIIGFLDKIAGWIERNKVPILDFFNELKRLLVEPFAAPAEKPAGPMPKGPGKIDWESEVSQLGTLGATPTVSFDGILTAITNVRDFILNDLIPAFNDFKDWITENKPTIDEFASTVGEIVSGVVKNLFEANTGGEGGGGGGILDVVKGFMEFVIQNKDTITDIITLLIEFFVMYQIAATITSLAITQLIELASTPGIQTIFMILAAFPALLMTIILLFDKVSTLASKVVTWAAELAAKMVNKLIAFITVEIPRFITFMGNKAKEAVENFITMFITGMGGFGTKLINSFKTAVSGFYAWDEGKTIGGNIIDGIAAGISAATGAVYEALRTMVTNMITNIKRWLGAKSPSMVMFDIGKNIIGEGLINGIEAFVGPAVATMTNAMRAVTTAATPSYSMAPSSVSTAYNTSNTFNLAINSRARTEQIVQDFNMMQSMVGA